MHKKFACSRVNYMTWVFPVCVWYIAHVAVNGTVLLATRDTSRDT